MTKIVDGLTKRSVVTEQTPVVRDLSGYDAMSRDPAQLRLEVQNFANACLPQALRKALYIVQNSKSAKDIMQAAKFIKSVADGKQVQARAVNSVVKKFTDEQLNTALSGSEDE